MTETEELAATGQRQRRDARLAAHRRYRGTLTGVYPPGHRESLREDWPE